MVRVKARRTIILLAFVISINTRVVLPAEKTKAKGCGNSTVADFAPPMVKGAERFLAHLKFAIRADRKADVAGMMAYPLNVFERNKKKIIHDRGEFIANYDRLITAGIRWAVNSQSKECLFANYRGVMIGHGEVWYGQFRDGSFRIITLNLNGPKH